MPLQDTFQRQVWCRIAAAQDASLSARMARWLDGMCSLLVRPVMATAAVLVMAAVGAWLGSADAHSVPNGKLAYVASVSPFAHFQGGGSQ